MITCPNCKQTLQDWVQTCQFCGTSVANVPRPKEAQKPTYRKGPAPWIVALYHVFAALWIVDGLRILLVGTHVLPADAAAGSFAEFAVGLSAVLLVFGVFFIFVGVGLLFKWEPMRGIANVICWLGVLAGLRNLAFAILLSPVGGLSGFLNVILSMFSIAWVGAQIWVIAETD